MLAQLSFYYVKMRPDHCASITVQGWECEYDCKISIDWLFFLSWFFYVAMWILGIAHLDCYYPGLCRGMLNWKWILAILSGTSKSLISTVNINMKWLRGVKKKDAKMQKPDQVIRCNALRVPCKCDANPRRVKTSAQCSLNEWDHRGT
jgi:hypothetical protein